MTPKSVLPSSQAAHNRMKAVKRSGTKAEDLLRKALTELGLEYQVNAHPLSKSSRKADVLFPNEKVAIFVDGCFWHGCPIHGTQAKANAEFWHEKIEANKRRDLDTNRQLQENGWLVIRAWEHENPQEVAQRIDKVVTDRRWAP
jgi:DNA mismatch endonuclease (patch repair protein)